MKLLARLIFVLLACLQLAPAMATPGPNHYIGLDDVVKLLLKDEIHINHAALEKINDVLVHLEKRQLKYKSEDDFVEYLYYYTHRKILKAYSEYPSLEETLLDGKYDCLTATAVYAILLNELDISHAIVETNYHIYILVHPGTANELLIETTDPRNGFIKGQDEVRVSKNHYLRNNLEPRNTLISFDFDLERKLAQKEIIGLLYYNQAIKQINLGDWQKASEFASMAKEYYTETRVSTLIEMIDTLSL